MTSIVSSHPLDSSLFQQNRFLSSLFAFAEDEMQGTKKTNTHLNELDCNRALSYSSAANHHNFVRLGVTAWSARLIITWHLSFITCSPSTLILRNRNFPKQRRKNVLTKFTVCDSLGSLVPFFLYRTWTVLRSIKIEKFVVDDFNRTKKKPFGRRHWLWQRESVSPIYLLFCVRQTHIRFDRQRLTVNTEQWVWEFNKCEYCVWGKRKRDKLPYIRRGNADVLVWSLSVRVYYTWMNGLTIVKWWRCGWWEFSKLNQLQVAVFDVNLLFAADKTHYLSQHR